MSDRTQATPAGYAPPAGTDPADSLPPSLIDGRRYALVRKLGGGGMGVVYLLRNVGMDRPEVVKLIRPDGIGSAELVDRFRSEIRAIGRLNHPHVAVGYGTDEIDGTLVLAMEFVDGTDLAELVRQNGPLPVGRACEYVRQAALGLQHAHDRGLVHRDVKPHNLLLRKENGQEWVKVIDFGLAKSAALDPLREARTQAEQLLGSPPYMAPEQWAGASGVGPPADVYALGCVLYFLLAGRPPFDHCRDRHQLMLAHVTEPPPPITDFRPDVPAALAGVLDRLLGKRPEDRPASAGEAGERLAPFVAMDSRTEVGGPVPVSVDGSTATFARPPGTNDPDTERLPVKQPLARSRPNRRWRVPAMLAGGMFAVAMAVGVVALQGEGRRPETAGLPDETGERVRAVPPVVAPNPDPTPPATAKSADPTPPALPVEVKRDVPKPARVRPVHSSFGPNSADGWTTTAGKGGTRPIGFDHSGGQWWIKTTRVGPDPFMWVAPDKFHGDQSGQFGKWLVWYSFAPRPIPPGVLDEPFAVLRGPGGALAVKGKEVKQKVNEYKWRVFAVRLDSAGRWLHSPRKGVPGTPASDADIKAVLADVKVLHLRGEYNGPDGTLDMVTLGADEIPK